MLKKLLITGAAGGLGRLARENLADFADTLRLSDITALTPASNTEEVMCGDLGDSAFVDRLVEGCDGILHLGGISIESHFDAILNANIVGVHNLYSAAQKHGQPRILFASSNHTIGFHKPSTRLDASSTLRPDSYYGVSKCFGEAVASLYHDKLGQETAIVRIGSCYPQPQDVRMLSTWLSPRDFLSLIRRVFTAPKLGCPVIYGVSANKDTWWDNHAVQYLGWEPQDSSESYRADIKAQAAQRGQTSDSLLQYQGGNFALAPLMQKDD